MFQIAANASVFRDIALFVRVWSADIIGTMGVEGNMGPWLGEWRASMASFDLRYVLLSAGGSSPITFSTLRAVPASAGSALPSAASTYVSISTSLSSIIVIDAAASPILMCKRAAVSPPYDGESLHASFFPDSPGTSAYQSMLCP